MNQHAIIHCGVNKVNPLVCDFTPKAQNEATLHIEVCNPYWMDVILTLSSLNMCLSLLYFVNNTIKQYILQTTQ